MHQGRTPFGDYIVFIDESGDHGLISIDPQFPIFVLVCVMVEKSAYVKNFVPALKALKLRFWGHDAIVLRGHDIRKPRSDFAFLQNRTIRSEFVTAINEIMDAVPMTVAMSVIDKTRLAVRHEDLFNPYHLAMAACLSQVADFLSDSGQHGKTTHLVAEGRGRREDQDLKQAFDQIIRGDVILDGVGHEIPFEMRIVPKAMNIEGLQLADLIAHPIARHALNPDQPNRAFDIIRSKLLNTKSTAVPGWGLTRFPDGN